MFCDHRSIIAIQGCQYKKITELFGLICHHGEIAFSNSRYTGYFRNRRNIEEDYRKAAEFVNSEAYENIGLLLSLDTYDYPLTVMINDEARVEHINVRNATSRYEDLSFVPDVIIAAERNVDETGLECHGYHYEITEVISEDVILLERQ